MQETVRFDKIESDLRTESKHDLEGVPCPLTDFVRKLSRWLKATNVS